MTTTRAVPMATRLAAIIMIAAAPAGAQSLRCQDRLVQTGDSKAAVIGKCGQPVQQDSYCKPVEPSATPAPVVVPCETVDEWTYNPGSGKFLVRLRFEQGVLKSMVNGERVP